MPALHRRRWTLDEVDRLAEERPGLTPRYELVDGELLVTPAPTRRHQRIVAELLVLLRAYVNEHQLGEVSMGPGVARVASDSRFEPDLFVIPSLDGKRRRADDMSVTGASLIVEVLSPGSSRHDRITKRRYFQSRGVPEYWVIDGDAEAFEIWHPGDVRAALVDDRLRWHPAEAAAPFELDVARFFSEIADDQE
ncbi:MAG: Uma2 family endonuclease [Gemmatimonadaceae bacterium]